MANKGLSSSPDELKETLQKGIEESSVQHKTVIRSSGLADSTICKLLGIVLSLCIASMLIQRFQGGNGIPSFQSLFNFLSSWNPPAQLPFLSFNSFTSQDWGILNFIKDLFVMLAQVLNVLVFFFNGLVTVVSYVVVLFQWLFVF